MAAFTGVGSLPISAKPSAGRLAHRRAPLPVRNAVSVEKSAKSLKLDKSEEIFTAAKELMPGGVNSPVRAFRSVGGQPIVFDSVKGSRMWDVDGNEYVDYVGSWGPAIIGHADDKCSSAGISSTARTSLLTPLTIGARQRHRCNGVRVIEMRDRSKNRKPTQRGRYLSSEAILAVQSLKRSKSFLLPQLQDARDPHGSDTREREKVRRLVKKDMVAVMRELLSQEEPRLALLVFEEIRKEHWYRPQLSMYLDIISVLARSNLKNELEQTCSCMKREYDLEADTERFNLLIGVLLEFGFVQLAMDCYRLMKLWECEPDECTYRVLVRGLESRGRMDISQLLRVEAKKQYYGLGFLDEKEESVQSS